MGASDRSTLKTKAHQGLGGGAQTFPVVPFHSSVLRTVQERPLSDTSVLTSKASAVFSCNRSILTSTSVLCSSMWICCLPVFFRIKITKSRIMGGGCKRIVDRNHERLRRLFFSDSLTASSWSPQLLSVRVSPGPSSPFVFPPLVTSSRLITSNTTCMLVTLKCCLPPRPGTQCPGS